MKLKKSLIQVPAKPPYHNSPCWDVAGFDSTVRAGPSQYPAGSADNSGSLTSFAAVTAFLRSRLLDTFSTQAASLAMRPSLHNVYTNLLNLLSSTAETPGANHSFLLLGSRGTGKSLVRSHPCQTPLLKQLRSKQICL